MDVLGCHTAPELIARWNDLFVARRAPFFFTEAARDLLPKGALCFTREEFAADFIDVPLAFRDSYATYRVDRKAIWVALLDDAMLMSLPINTREDLLRLQWENGRGLIFPLVTIQEWLAHWQDDLSLIENAAFETTEGMMVAPAFTLWWALSEGAREVWLRQFIEADRENCLSSRLDVMTWDAITHQHGPHIRQLSGSFALDSGPNCFATALAAAMPEHGIATADFWLHQAPFFRAITRLGYAQVPLNGSIPPGTILIWEGAEGIAQHACFTITDTLVLNKDAQAWFEPRQIVPLDHVISRWQADECRLVLYMR